MADRELQKLTRYLLHVAEVPDFRTLSHKVRYDDANIWFTGLICGLRRIGRVSSKGFHPRDAILRWTCRCQFVLHRD